MESMIVRLKSLRHPPAIIILEVAAKEGVNLERYRRLARHYGLLEVDWQAAVNKKLREGAAWGSLFQGEIHPTARGHDLYGEAFIAKLAPMVDEARERSLSVATEEHDRTKALPTKLSQQSLLLDARMVALSEIKANDWKSEAGQARLFPGLLMAEKHGAELKIPVRGTTFGLLYPTGPNFGPFSLSVNGNSPSLTSQKGPEGQQGMLIAATDPPSLEHSVSTVVIDGGPENPVKLGYLLLAGESDSSREKTEIGPFDSSLAKKLNFQTLLASTWKWTGPFYREESKELPPVMDARRLINIPFLSETPEGFASSHEWKPIDQDGNVIDFRKLTSSSTPGIIYAATSWHGSTNGVSLLSISIDYFAKVWVNGNLVLTVDGPHRNPILVTLKTIKGENTIIVKLGAGSRGFDLRVRVADSIFNPPQDGNSDVSKLTRIL